MYAKISNNTYADRDPVSIHLCIWEVSVAPV